MKIKDRAKPKIPAVAPGVYMAVCVGVVDLGEQYSELFKSYSNKVKFVWALPAELIEIDGKQEERQLSREFSVATKNTSKLRTYLSSWNSKTYSDDEFLELDMFEQVGKACMLNVILNETGEYSNVDSIMPVPNGIPAPASKTAFFTWDMDHWDDAAFEKLPAWTQEQIKKSTQYQKTHAPVTTVEVKTDSSAALGMTAGVVQNGQYTPSVTAAPSQLPQGGSQGAQIATGANPLAMTNGVVQNAAVGMPSSAPVGGTFSQEKADNGGVCPI